MRAPERILVQAIAPPPERAAIRRAGQRLAESLGDGQNAWPIDCVFLESLEAMDRSRDPSILVTSLLPELAHLDEPWTETEGRLRERYGRLGRDKGLLAYVSTVFRHIDSDQRSEQAARLRARIRRLNLLAVELSHETGVSVIDLDRELADVGGRVLQTDYRLAGDLAVEMAGGCIAATLLATGLDAAVPFEVQDAAVARLAAERTARDTGSQDIAADTTVAVRSGRRIQHAQIAGRRDNQVAFYLRQLASGKVSAREAAVRLAGAVSRRGFRSSAATVVAGVARVLRPGRGDRRL